MKRWEVRRFLDEKVLGQLRNGLFFEGSVGIVAGELVVVEDEEAGVVDLSEIRWLTVARSYC